MTIDASLLEWIAVDWGTTNLRAWAMAKDGAVLVSATSHKGMQSLRPDEFEAALLELITDWLVASRTIPVICCGMVGARQGWSEAPYQRVPCTPVSGEHTVCVISKDLRMSVHIVAGIKQENPADVMRGEETQIAGFLASHPDFEGVVCLPGTHTKWLRVVAEKIVHFSTFMTGELFSLISRHSVLQHSVSSKGWDKEAFVTALNETISMPTTFANKLFGLRALSLVSELEPITARAQLSGMLIGLELSASQQYWRGQNVIIIGDSTLAKVYEHALSAQGLNPDVIDVEALTLAGLNIAYSTLKE